VLDRLSALPGVQSVGGISTLPLSGPQGRLSFAIEGRSTDIGDAPSTQSALVTPSYFRTLGIELVRGRLFDDHDDTRAPIAAVVSETFAKQFFADDDPIGKRVTPGSRVRPAGPQQPPPNAFTIVGIVRESRSRGATERALTPAQPTGSPSR
jgi:putative ABC transport system permease protein